MAEPIQPRQGPPPDERRGPRITEDGIAEIGFDDPALRPLPPDKLHYHIPHPDAHPEWHEHSDVPIRPLAIALAGIAGVCVLTCVVLYWLFWHYKGQQQAQELPRTAVPMATPAVPEPRLQGVPGYSDNHPRQDLKQLRDHYNDELTGYGRNGDAPTARVPIDKAMDLALERKLFPMRAQGAAGATGSQQSPQQRERRQGEQR